MAEMRREAEETMHSERQKQQSFLRNLELEHEAQLSAKDDEIRIVRMQHEDQPYLVQAKN